MRFILGFTMMFTAPLWAKKPNAAKEVDAVLAKYREAAAIEAKVKKTVVNEVMGMDNKSSGEFYFSKGKLRMDITEPEKTVLVYDGKFVWMEQEIEDGKKLVTKLRTNELKRSKSVLTALFEKKDVLRNFKHLKSSKDGESQTHLFEPKSSKDEQEVRELEVTLKKKEIERISYKDQLENKVTFDFSEVRRGEVPAKKFTYKVPKGAEVTEI